MRARRNLGPQRAGRGGSCFTTPHPIGERIAEHDAQLTNGKGYDHNWVLDGASGKLWLAARVSEPTSGRIMELLTTEPGQQYRSTTVYRFSTVSAM